DLHVLAVLHIVHCSLPNYKNDSVPICVRVVGKCAGNQEEPVSVVAPVAYVQIAVNDDSEWIRGRHSQGRQGRSRDGGERIGYGARGDGNVCVLNGGLRGRFDLTPRFHGSWARPAYGLYIRHHWSRLVP